MNTQPSVPAIETHESVLLDCMTGEAWSANLVTPVECVSLSFRTHPCVLAFITQISRINGIEMALVWLIWYIFSYIFFNFAICFIALMNLGETCHLKRWDMVTAWWTTLLLCCYNCDCTEKHYDVTQFECVLWRHTMLEWDYEYLICITKLESPKRFTNIIPTPSKQWGVCDKLVNQIISRLMISKEKEFPAELVICLVSNIWHIVIIYNVNTSSVICTDCCVCTESDFSVDNYRQTFNIKQTKYQNLNSLVSSCSCFCPTHWS